jgi:DNA-binding CsgD family transcriptional regulator
MAANAFAEAGDPLTTREFEVMVRYARLGVMKLVAAEMGIKTRTVHTFLTTVYRKLDVTGLGAVAAFHALGWLRIPGDAEIEAYGELEDARRIETKLRRLRAELDQLIERVAA